MMLNTRLTKRLLLATLCFLMGAISAAPASAAMIYGDNIHTASGNDRNASDISDVLSDLAGEYVPVEELARVEFDEGSNPSDGLELVINEFKDDTEWIAGEWTYAGPEIVDYIAVKAGPQWALFDFTNADMPNAGLFRNDFAFNTNGKGRGNNANQNPFGVSHVTAYNIVGSTVIPEPASIALLGLASAALLPRRRTQTA